ncbi:tRNA uridine-5-carboxymethylaminomethyl(34) synthesis GTPase MnmE [Camelimonas fluminis]|uniref:tRNA modification GTPase MnmE n=1 Tax=Camelimonas fluminis TaxID=1576911 RepID=A0ABV7UKR9_9HYPH|nr:tRNA uridine-5-carboxymethylaminomethyl(34) synthesis GTPase MnmE [Camelimonas fluminis]
MKFTYGSDADTIYAPATPVGRSALAIVRVSGPQTQQVFLQLCGRIPESRKATLSTLRDRTGVPIDQALVLYFPGASSPTGEEAGEFHLHGNMLLVDAFALELEHLGLRLAQPGEFTRRAVLAGKLDLTQAEALADLVEAETTAQRRQAVSQLYGALGDPVLRWRNRLLDALSLIEADIDFSDEDDVGEGLFMSALTIASQVSDEIQTVLRDRGIGERVRDGFRVVIAGPPNAGKSTLLNCLAGRDVAIVTDIPGTTRDVLEVRLDLGGLPVRLFDTAGLHESGDVVEQIGMARANDQLDAADVVLWLKPAVGPDSDQSRIPPPLVAKVIHVLTKVDRLGAGEATIQGTGADVAVSAVSGAGVDALVLAIQQALPVSSVNEGMAITRRRHREALTAAVAALCRLPQGTEENPTDWTELVLWAEDLRQAVFHVGCITGHARPDDVLDRIFTAFCIGK